LSISAFGTLITWRVRASKRWNGVGSGGFMLLDLKTKRKNIRFAIVNQQSIGKNISTYKHLEALMF
jgi:hypothetical protein